MFTSLERLKMFFILYYFFGMEFFNNIRSCTKMTEFRIFLSFFSLFMLRKCSNSANSQKSLNGSTIKRLTVPGVISLPGSIFSFGKPFCYSSARTSRAAFGCRFDGIWLCAFGRKLHKFTSYNKNGRFSIDINSAICYNNL